MDDTRSSDALTPQPIFLVGFMGSGKTSVGRILAKELGRRFIDLDEMISRKAGAPVREIFSTQGEPAFRQLEREAIQSLSELDNTIVALGGGAYVSQENRDIIRSIGPTVWIDCPLDVCLSRIPADGSRPMLGDRAAMETLMAARCGDYSLAVVRIAAQDLDPHSIVRRIIRSLVELKD